MTNAKSIIFPINDTKLNPPEKKEHIPLLNGLTISSITQLPP
jgi:hypothetical protein